MRKFSDTGDAAQRVNSLNPHKSLRQEAGFSSPSSLKLVGGGRTIRFFAAVILTYPLIGNSDRAGFHIGKRISMVKGDSWIIKRSVRIN
jgi:hypothetical protein